MFAMLLETTSSAAEFVWSAETADEKIAFNVTGELRKLFQPEPVIARAVPPDDGATPGFRYV